MTIKAVLLDLDNTLLQNPDREFARAFLRLFKQHFMEIGRPQATNQLRDALTALGQARTGTTTNHQMISEYLGGDDPEVIAHLNHFYAEPYQLLQPYIKPVKGASELILKLRERDLAVVIATNPIYPKQAIEMRMQWAGLPQEDNLYALITASDVMHFTKPDPAYYAEILGRVGIEPDEALMLGDRMENDIRPAAQVGLHTFHCDHTTLYEIIPDLLQQITQLSHRPLQAEMIMPQLRGNLGALFGFLDDVKPTFWSQHPDENEWSIVQILCHLADFEDRNERPRLEKILNEDNPFITQPPEPGLDIPACAEDGYLPAQLFLEAREKTIDFIKHLSANEWQRPARHSIFGLTTLLEMAHFTAQHDRLHLKQLCQTIGRCE